MGPPHMPANIGGIEACLDLGDSVPRRYLTPPSIRRCRVRLHYAIPHEMYEKYGVRRYGFHGTSQRI